MTRRAPVRTTSLLAAPPLLSAQDCVDSTANRRRPGRRAATGAAALLLALGTLPALAVPEGPNLPSTDPVAGSLPPEAARPADLPARGEVLERALVLYDPATGAIARRLVRVHEAFPGEGLEFLWEPFDSLGLDEESFASGRGRLSWRIPGAATYDPRALAATYEGTLRRGAPEGEGRLLLRDGSWRDGEWHAGLQQGSGRWSRPDGSLYEGQFRAGLPEGEGVLRAAAGWIYEGPFRAGLPEGEGRLRTPDGTEREVVMAAGVEVPAAGGEEDPLLVQGAGDAARVQISVVTNARVALEQSIVYTHYNTGEALQIYPKDGMFGENELLALWSGNGRFGLPYPLEEMTTEDWLATRAFLDVTLETTDGGTVLVNELRLVDDSSSPWLRPMLDTTTQFGCVGHRPWFEIVNAGWGPVEAPRLRVGFIAEVEYDDDHNPVFPAPDSSWVEVPISGFDAGVTVDLAPTLRALGLDVDTLASNRFSCPGRDELDTCARNLLDSLELGALAGKLRAGDGSATLTTTVAGELSYSWRDAQGELQQEVEQFSQEIALARIEVGGLGVEMGAGGAFATPAPDFQEVELPMQGQDLQLALPLRGNPNLSRAEAHLQLYAQRSSVHLLRIEAELGDGSVASSMPLQLFYLSPRDTSDWQSTIRPEACFMPAEDWAL